MLHLHNQSTSKMRQKNNPPRFALLFFAVIFLTVFAVFNLKQLADLRTKNWILCKENAALKKTVKDHLAENKFLADVSSTKDDIEMEEAMVTVGLPNSDYMFNVRVVWYSPDVTPCHMGWLINRLADQMYG